MHIPVVEMKSCAFPIVIEFFSKAAGDMVWATTIEGGGVLSIPPLVCTHGPVRVRVTYADGAVVEAEALPLQEFGP